MLPLGTAPSQSHDAQGDVTAPLRAPNPHLLTVKIAEVVGVQLHPALLIDVGPGKGPEGPLGDPAAPRDAPKWAGVQEGWYEPPRLELSPHHSPLAGSSGYALEVRVIPLVHSRPSCQKPEATLPLIPCHVPSPRVTAGDSNGDFMLSSGHQLNHGAGKGAATKSPPSKILFAVTSQNPWAGAGPVQGTHVRWGWWHPGLLHSRWTGVKRRGDTLGLEQSLPGTPLPSPLQHRARLCLIHPSIRAAGEATPAPPTSTMSPEPPLQPPAPAAAA